MCGAVCRLVSSQCLHADGSWRLRSCNCLFLSKVINLRLSSPNSCQLSQKLWKYNIFGISASSSEGIEIDPTVSELLGGGGGGDGTGSTSLQPRFNLKKTKLKKLSRKMLKLGVNVGYSNHVIFFFFCKGPWLCCVLTGSGAVCESWVLST